MKKGLIGILSLILIVNLSLVLAEKGDSNDIIMKISSNMNAHAGTYNSSETIPILYSDIFEGEFALPDGGDVHACSSSTATLGNKITNLYDTTNSHVSDVYDAEVYNGRICYGNLRCELRESDCLAGEEPIAKQFREQNSHISKADSESAYPYNICCASSYWADMNNEVINSTGLESTVKIVVAPTPSLNDNADDGVISVDFVDDGFWIFDKDILEDFNLTYDSDLMAYVGELTITEELLQDADLNTSFYFEVGGVQFPLNISLTPIKGLSQIESNVRCGEVFNKSDTISIEGTALDPNDRINGSIYIKGEWVEGFSNGGYKFNYTFEDKDVGEMQIEINSTSEDGTESASYIANIIVLNHSEGGFVPNQKYTAACIDKPSNYADFEEEEVQFDASTTVGVIVDGDGVRHNLIPGLDPFIFDWVFTGEAISSGLVDSKVLSNRDSPESYTDDDFYQFMLIYLGAGTKTADLTVELPSDVNWDTYDWASHTWDLI